jgi:hypothetical protein
LAYDPEPVFSGLDINLKKPTIKRKKIVKFLGGEYLVILNPKTNEIRTYIISAATNNFKGEILEFARLIL